MNEEKRANEKFQKIKEEKEYLDHVAMEIDLQSALDRMEHLQKQQVLLEAWEKDSHIRNIEKLRDVGSTDMVSTYVLENLAPSDKSMKMSNMGVGFDTRS